MASSSSIIPIAAVRASIYVVKREYSTLFVSPARRCLKPGDLRSGSLAAPGSLPRLTRDGSRNAPVGLRPPAASREPRRVNRGTWATSRIRAVRVSPDTR